MMYQVIFEDDSIYNGGDIQNSGWNEMPNKNIKLIKSLINKNPIMLSGFEEYNHLIERAKGINKKLDKLTSIMFFGRDGEKVQRLIFDFIKNKVLKDTVPYGKEYRYSPAQYIINHKDNKELIPEIGSNTSGWKKGLKTNNPKIYKLK